jgi:uncharacterized ubiquitin-like protein YukD
MQNDQPIVRLARRKSWCESSVEEIIKIEFTNDDNKIDLNVSVYMVFDKPQSLIQITAEHIGQTDVRPETRALFNVRTVFDGIADLVHAPADGFFSFRNNQHYELHIADASSLKKLVETILENHDQIILKCIKNEIKSYAKTQYKQLDPEWIKAVEMQKNLASWIK